MLKVFLVFLFFSTFVLKPAAAHTVCASQLAIEVPREALPLDPTQKLNALKDELSKALVDIKNLKCILCIRNFAPRADLMNFLEKKFGLDWLDQGNALLARILQNKTWRHQLTPDERLLADGTVYFSAIELNLNKKDIQLDESRLEKTNAALKIAQIEAEIEEQLRQGAIDSAPFYRRHYTEDYVRSLERDVRQIEQSLSVAQNEKNRLRALLDSLNDEGIYVDAVDIHVRALPTRARSVWRTLGHDNAPYEATSP